MPAAAKPPEGEAYEAQIAEDAQMRPQQPQAPEAVAARSPGSRVSWEQEGRAEGACSQRPPATNSGEDRMPSTDQTGARQ